MKVILSVPDEGYSRNVSFALNLISTFLFELVLIIKSLKKYLLIQKIIKKIFTDTTEED
jgi:hypothetical protein